MNRKMYIPPRVCRPAPLSVLMYLTNGLVWPVSYSSTMVRSLRVRWCNSNKLLMKPSLKDEGDVFHVCFIMRTFSFSLFIFVLVSPCFHFLFYFFEIFSTDSYNKKLKKNNNKVGTIRIAKLRKNCAKSCFLIPVCENVLLNLKSLQKLAII